MRDRRVGEYAVGRKLGAGPFCEAYLGEHSSSRTQVVLKRVHPALVAVPKICVRLRAQAISPPRLDHPRIAGLETMILEREEVWLVTAYATGAPFEDTLFSSHHPDSILPAWCRLLEAFDYAHRRGVIHADLKGTNLLVEPGGEFRVLDFTTSRLFGYTPSTRDLLGAGPYRSPEQAAGEDIDARTDIYALGKILLRLLGTTPGAFDGVIRRATAEDKEARYRSVAEFRRALLERAPAPDASIPEVAPRFSETPVTVIPMSLIDRIRKPLQTMLSKTAFVANGHTVEGASVPIPQAAAKPDAAPAPREPEERVKPKSLKEVLASEMVEFDLDVPRLAKPVEMPAAAPAPPPPAAAEEDLADDPLDAGFAAFRRGDLQLARRMWLAAKRVDSSNRVIDYNLRVVERKLAASSGR